MRRRDWGPDQNADEFALIGDPETQHNLLCQLSIKAHVESPSRTPILRSAWKRGKSLAFRGRVYGVTDGLLRDFDCGTSHAGPRYEEIPTNASERKYG